MNTQAKMEDKQQEQLIRLSVMLEELVRKVNIVSDKIDAINNIHIRETDSRLAVYEDKVKRLEYIIYGVITITVGQAIGLLTMIIKN